jgi:cytochrome c556
MATLRAVVVSVLFLNAVGCSQQQAQGPQSAFKEVASVQEIMESLVAHMAEEVFASVGTIVDEKGITEIFPKNDEEWTEVGYAAMGLAETGNLLMMDGRVNQHAKNDREEWISLSQQLIERSVIAAERANAKDADGLLTAGGELYEVCQACHMKYIVDDAFPPAGTP